MDGRSGRRSGAPDPDTRVPGEFAVSQGSQRALQALLAANHRFPITHSLNSNTFDQATDAADAMRTLREQGSQQ